MYSKRQQGGDSTMVWGSFGYYGKAEIQPVPARSNSHDYQEVLRQGLLLQGRMGGKGFIFQQDNAPIHVSQSTNPWLEEDRIRTLSWPARSPGLNPMENVCGYLSRNVYAHGRQYNSRAELEAAIYAEWDKIPQEYLQNLSDTMKNRDNH